RLMRSPLHRPRSGVIRSSRSPRAASSTLFPYTTLFRSVGRQSRGGDTGLCRPARVQSLRVRAISEELQQPRRHAARDSERVSGRDRKSTRLNSSHVKISYAVFCLKKKNDSNPNTIDAHE